GARRDDAHRRAEHGRVEARGAHRGLQGPRRRPHGDDVHAARRERLLRRVHAGTPRRARVLRAARRSPQGAARPALRIRTALWPREVLMNTVTSADGTTIAVERSGSGPPVILVCGGSTDRMSNAGVAEILSERFTALNYDRRGRGDSGDTE